MGAAEKMLVQLSAEELEALIERVVARTISAHNSLELSHEDAAAQLGITPNALHKRVQKGLIKPDIRGGTDGVKSNRFAQATIDAYKRRQSR
jgi:hypothetical protein